MTDAASPRSRRAQPQNLSSGEAIPFDKPFVDKRLEALRVAEGLFHHKPDWVMFFRELLGVGGVVSRLFPTSEERAAFEQSSEYADIQRMLGELRSQGALPADVDDKEPTRVITVRLPKSMHEALRAEAYSRQISMNKLCIAKLVQALDAAAQEDDAQQATENE